MEFLEVSETARAREIDAELKKNKWRNEWLDETDKKDRPFRMWLRKCMQPGTAWCLLCGKKIIYKSNGKKSISSPKRCGNRTILWLAVLKVKQTETSS